MTQEQRFGDDQNFPKGDFEGYVPREDSDTATPANLLQNYCLLENQLSIY